MPAGAMERADILGSLHADSNVRHCTTTDIVRVVWHFPASITRHMRDKGSDGMKTTLRSYAVLMQDAPLRLVRVILGVAAFSG